MDINSDDYKLMLKIAKTIMDLGPNNLANITRFDSPESDYFIQIKYFYGEDGSIITANASVHEKNQ